MCGHFLPSFSTIRGRPTPSVACPEQAAARKQKTCQTAHAASGGGIYGTYSGRPQRADPRRKLRLIKVEVDPPAGEEPLQWRLLIKHAIADAAATWEIFDYRYARTAGACRRCPNSENCLAAANSMPSPATTIPYRPGQHEAIGAVAQTEVVIVRLAPLSQVIRVVDLDEAQTCPAHRWVGNRRSAALSSRGEAWSRHR
jgi:hypothetical protein